MSNNPETVTVEPGIYERFLRMESALLVAELRKRVADLEWAAALRQCSDANIAADLEMAAARANLLAARDDIEAIYEIELSDWLRDDDEYRLTRRPTGGSYP